MNKTNKNETIKEISEMLHHVLKGIKDGTHRESYLDYEIYGCLEKTSKGNIKVRISEETYKSYKEQFDNLNIYYKDDDGLKHIPGNLKAKLHAEHIFPRKLLREELMKLKPEYEPKKIQECLMEFAKGILITKDECKLLDVGEGNLKDTMPDNWKIVEDRLFAKKIKIHKENGNDVYYTIAGF